MDDYVIEECEPMVVNDAGTFRALVLADPHYDWNPREDDGGQIGVMVATYPRYTLPSEDGPVAAWRVEEAISDHRFAVVARWLRMAHGASVVLPIYSAGGRDLVLAPGSGATEEDVDPGNYIGVIYDSPAAREDLGPNVTREGIVEILRTEVKCYSTWANGEMTAWSVDRTDQTGDDEAAAWDVVESTGGYFTVKDAREEAIAALESIAAHALAEHVVALHDEALDENEIHDLAVSEA